MSQHATVMHPLGAITVMDIQRVAEINRMKALRGEACWLVVGLHDDLEGALADAAKIKKIFKERKAGQEEKPT